MLKLQQLQLKYKARTITIIRVAFGRARGTHRSSRLTTNALLGRMLPKESTTTTTKPATAPCPSLASLRARPVLRSSGLRIEAGLRDLTKAARNACWSPEDEDQPERQHDEHKAAGTEGVPPKTDEPRGTPTDTAIKALYSLGCPILPIPPAPSAIEEKAPDTARLLAGDDDARLAIRHDKAAASALLSRMVQLYSAHASKDGRSAFEAALLPFVHTIPLDDPLVPGLLVPNAGAGPSLPQLAKALLALDTCLHKSSKSVAFAACDERWRSQVRSARPPCC